MGGGVRVLKGGVVDRGGGGWRDVWGEGLQGWPAGNFEAARLAGARAALERNAGWAWSGAVETGERAGMMMGRGVGCYVGR